MKSFGRIPPQGTPGMLPSLALPRLSHPCPNPDSALLGFSNLNSHWPLFSILYLPHLVCFFVSLSVCLFVCLFAHHLEQDGGLEDIIVVMMMGIPSRTQVPRRVFTNRVRHRALPGSVASIAFSGEPWPAPPSFLFPRASGD